jgi:hypothetical protein
LTPAVAQLLSQLLYNQPELRPSVLRALKTLVDSSVALAKQDAAALERHPALQRPDALTQAVAQRNVDALRAQADSWLAVLFNVFGSVARDARSSVGDVISSWADIASEQVRCLRPCRLRRAVDVPDCSPSRRRTGRFSRFSGRTSPTRRRRAVRRPRAAARRL